MARSPRSKPRASVASRKTAADAATGAQTVVSKPHLAKRRRAYLPASERRRRIILAAQEVFARTPLQGARTRQLAKAAEVNQATLFEHFASKEDLFVAAVVQPLLEAMQGMRDRAKSYSGAASVKDLAALTRASCQRHLEAMLRIYPLLAAALFSDPALGRKLYHEQIVPLLKERGEVMRGVVKDSIDPALLALAAFGAFFAVAMDQAFRGTEDDPAALATQLADLFAFGFARDRGR
jgi:TetR/AcrR family transcriptional regulator